MRGARQVGMRRGCACARSGASVIHPVLGALEGVVAGVDRMLARAPEPPVTRGARSSSALSVVVQGPVYGRPTDPPSKRYTMRCLESVRRALPHAELILSTWRGTDVAGLPADVVVLNDDPGPVAPRDPRGVSNNVNRQVVTTRAGLERASRPLAMKLRSDIELADGRALKLFGGWPARAERVRVLRERILVPTYYSFNPGRIYARFPYTVSDWCHVGLLEDLADLWATPHWDTSFEWLLGRRVVAVEQFLWMSLLNRHDEDATFERPDLIAHSELSIANNVVLLEPTDLGLRFLKFVAPSRHRVALYTHGEWVRLYERHCLGADRWGTDPQGAFRAVVARGWIRGVSERLWGPASDLRPTPRPVVPPQTPNQASVHACPEAVGLNGPLSPVDATPDLGPAR